MIDIYIAFTPSDFVYAERIYKILIKEGFKAYMSRPDLLYGAAQPEKEKEALRNASTFIFVTSSTDNANSSYVLSELQYFVNASSKQNQNPHVISILKDINSQDINPYLQQFEVLNFADFEHSASSNLLIRSSIRDTSESAVESCNHLCSNSCCPTAMPEYDDSESSINACPDVEYYDSSESAANSYYPANNIYSQTESDDMVSTKDKSSNHKHSFFRTFCRSLHNIFSSGQTILQARNKSVSLINACVFAPAEVRHNKTFIIRVYMYLPHEQDMVDSKVKEIDPYAVKKEYKPLDLPVKEGDKLSVQLNLSDGVECNKLTKTVIWRNHYTDCSFMTKLIDINQECIEGTAYMLVNDVPAGEMLFTIDVVDADPRELYTKVDSRRFSKIFISYAHQDESQVRGIAEGCRMLGKDYFFDRHTLQPGDIFKDKILNYIESADLFVLCWSKNAAESEWVQIEREYALQLIREGKSYLSIYPLCLRPEAPLPEDMSDKYNFGTL